MNEGALAIGIDFGTTNSSVAWYNPRTGEAEVILNAEGEVKTPSLVYFGERETLVGKQVEDEIENLSMDPAQRDEATERIFKSIKRKLLSPSSIALPDDHFIRPVEVVAEILKKLKRDAERGHFDGEEVKRAVITHPAEFKPNQKDQIEKAARLAGFTEVKLLDEPSAAALAYARAGHNVGEHVLVYDLGGGTFDLAVLDNEEGSFHVAMRPKGEEHLGGDDFDRALYRYCDEVARRELGRPISATENEDLKYLRECRKRKENFSYKETVRFSDYLASEGVPVRFEHEVDRETFEDRIKEYVETTARLTKEILEEARSRGHEVDSIVLIGGSSRVRLVIETLEQTLPAGMSLRDWGRKDVAVALGAAHYANMVWGTDGPDGSTDPALEKYRETVEEVFADRELDKAEVDRLVTFAEQLGLSQEQTANVERRVMGGTKKDVLYGQYRRLVEMVWADGKLNGMEVEWLGAEADELGLSREETANAESEVMGATREVVAGRQSPDIKPLVASESFVLAHKLAGHTDEVHGVAFGPDGQSLASGGSDYHALRGWNARTGRSAGALDGHTGRINSVAFSPDGNLLASGGFDKSIKIWKLPNGEPFHSLDHGAWVFSLAIGSGRESGRQLLASGGADGKIKLWSLENGKLTRTFAGHSHWVLSMAIDPDKQLLLSGSADKTVKVWDLKARTDEPLHIFEHPDWVRSVALGSDGRLAASGGEDGVIRLWDLKTGKLVRTMTGHSGPVLSVAMSPDGKLLASGGADGKIKTWNPSTGEPLHVLLGHRGGVGSVAVSSDGELLASGGHDRAVKVWKKEEIPWSTVVVPQDPPPDGPELGQPNRSPPDLPGGPGPSTRPPDLPRKPEPGPPTDPPKLPGGSGTEQPDRPPTLPGGPGVGQPDRPPNLPGKLQGKPGRPPNLPGGSGSGPSRPPKLPG